MVIVSMSKFSCGVVLDMLVEGVEQWDDIFCWRVGFDSHKELLSIGSGACDVLS